MIGLKTQDIDRDIIFIFLMGYEYSLSFTNLMKLFVISRKYFWTFLEICCPMLKMGVRKASLLKKSADKIDLCLRGRANPREELTPKEEMMYEMLTWFIEDSFSNGEVCLNIRQFKDIPNAKAFGNSGFIVASDYDNALKNVDRIEYIEVGENRFYRTSKLLFYMEKFCGDTEAGVLENLSVKEMYKRIVTAEEKLNAEDK